MRKGKSRKTAKTADPMMKKRKARKGTKSKSKAKLRLDIDWYLDEEMPLKNDQDDSEDDDKGWSEREGFSDDAQSMTASGRAELAVVAVDAQELERCAKAALNNRLHQLPNELLWMIVDYLDGLYDIGNLAEAMIPPEAYRESTPFRWPQLEIWFMKLELRQLRKSLDELKAFHWF